MRFYLPVMVILSFVVACENTTNTPYIISTPTGFVAMVIPPDNPTTLEGVALGKVLFFDPILSADSTVSCSSCHLPERAFTDGRPVSIGIEGRIGTRNAPTLLNVGFYYKGLLWDGRAATLEHQSLHPITDTVEMAANWGQVLTKIRRHPDYPQLFRSAFGINAAAIDSIHIAKALAQYQRTLISANALFDQKMRGEAVFNEQQLRGWAIFNDASALLPHSECAHCHADPLFTNLDYANNGLDQVNSLEDFTDKGRGRITGNRYDFGTFRVPTLRNIALTAPYMHDGRFATLEEVINHYTSGGHYAENLNPNIMPLQLSAQDKHDLLAFLHTLTDSTSLEIR
jgi:cytochrome c peroxidase